MAKPIGIALGIIGSKAPVPPEAIIEHAKPLQAPVAAKPAAPAKPKRPRKAEAAKASPEPACELQRARTADGQYRADDPATPAVNEAWLPAEEPAPTMELTLPAEGNS